MTGHENPGLRPRPGLTFERNKAANTTQIRQPREFIRAETWTILPPLTVPRYGTASAVIGNRLYVASGAVQGGVDIPNESPSHDAFEIPGK